MNANVKESFQHLTCLEKLKEKEEAILKAILSNFAYFSKWKKEIRPNAVGGGGCVITEAELTDVLDMLDLEPEINTVDEVNLKAELEGLKGGKKSKRTPAALSKKISSRKKNKG
jgi:hypothetical protein